MVTVNGDNLVVSAGVISATLLALDEDGLVIQPDADGSIHLGPNSSITFSAEGYRALSKVNLWLMSDPTLLGTASVDAAGSSSGRFSVGDKVPAGEHRIVLEGTVGSGTSAMLSIGVYVDRQSELSVAARVAIAVPVIGAIFFALVLPARRRTHRRRFV